MQQEPSGQGEGGGQGFARHAEEEGPLTPEENGYQVVVAGCRCNPVLPVHLPTQGPDVCPRLPGERGLLAGLHCTEGAWNCSETGGESPIDGGQIT